MILLLNGAFGVGKTTVAKTLARRLPRCVVFDPEIIGVALQRLARLIRRDVEDFQDLRLWRQLTILGLRATRQLCPNIIVPMAFSNAAYLHQIRAGAGRVDPHVFHFCLTAPIEVIRERLQRRGDNRSEWEYRRAAECCLLHDRPEFATQVPAFGRHPEQIADEILEALLRAS